jgi:hypothetical protein
MGRKAVRAEPRALWIGEIAKRWQGLVIDFIEIGNCLLQAKYDLPHGDFEAMVESDLPFGPRTARMLMAVAAHPILSDRNHGSVLPASWRTLYELTKLPEPALLEAINRGDVTADMQRKDVRKLLPAAARAEVEPVRTPARPACDGECHQHLDALTDAAELLMSALLAVRDGGGSQVDLTQAMDVMGATLATMRGRLRNATPRDAPPAAPEAPVYNYQGVDYKVGETLPDGRVVESIEHGVPVLVRRAEPQDSPKSAKSRKTTPHVAPGTPNAKSDDSTGGGKTAPKGKNDDALAGANAILGRVFSS